MESVRYAFADLLGLHSFGSVVPVKMNDDDFRQLTIGLLKGVTKNEFERDREIIKELFSDPNSKPCREWEIYIEVAMELGLID